MDTDETQALIDGYLDGMLTPEELTRLNACLASSADFARQFARAMLLHDRLRAVLQAEALGEPDIMPAPVERLRPRRRWTTTAAAALAASVLVAVGLWHGNAVPSASAAAVALDRVIEVAQQQIDRVYRIRVVDHGPRGVQTPVFADRGGRKPGVDGADLYVRGTNCFVLVLYFGNGTKFINGSNGEIGWSVPPTGRVHLSHDTRRFRRQVPGEDADLPFVDLERGLEGLRRDYRLELTAADDTPGAEPNCSRLDAVKRHGPGPECVRIWFDASGVARRIELTGLRDSPSGPRSVTLALVEQRDLGPKFFDHASHHAADRPIDHE